MGRAGAAAGAAAALALALARAASAAPASPVDVPVVGRQVALPVETTQSGAVRQALREAQSRHAETVADWMRIAETPALPGQERERGELLARLFRQAGLPARVLGDGNVEATLAGAPGRAPAVICAHLDALHAPSKENPVRREDDILRGPGVLDDASGLAALLASARHLAAAGYRPAREVRFVATVGEEVGLVGARSYVEAHPDLAGLVSIDGVLGAVDYGATGITWMKFRMTGRGGHTLLARRTPSPAFAAGRAIAAVATIAEGSDDPVNVGQVEGGTVPNAIPTEVWFSVDARSDDPGRLQQLERDLLRVTRGAADREGVTLTVETLQSLPAARLPGHGSSPLVLGARGILEWLGVTPTALPRGSSDHNVALMRGIPAIAVGATAGRGAHAPTEVAEIGTLERGVSQVILLAVLLGEGLPEPARPSAQ
jgi:acetylornithine deacetylase/succinyl-diaminopimelate desuccinylase-like protein